MSKELTHYFYDRPLEANEGGLLANRTQPIQRLDEAIAGAKEGQPENFAILGEEGMGKTSLSEITYAKAKNIATNLASTLGDNFRNDRVSICERIMSSNYRSHKTWIFR